MMSLLALAIATLVSALPARAASQQDWTDCLSTDPDVSIAGCSRILQGAGETPQHRADAYNNLCVSWNDKANYDRAITNCTEAIRLIPNFPEAYSNRGMAWRGKGDLERAIADYNETIRLNPKYAKAYSNRASVWFDKRNTTAPLPITPRQSASTPSVPRIITTR